LILIVVLTSDISKFPDRKLFTAQEDDEISAPAFCDAGTSDRSNGTRVCTREDVLEAIASRPLAFEPWTRPLYSNTGFNLLGWAVAESVEKNTTQPNPRLSTSRKEAGIKSSTLEDLLHDDVFTPLGMKDTSFWVPLDKRQNVAVPGKDVPCMIDWNFTSTFNPYLPPHL
jgi:hypothetical protein